MRTANVPTLACLLVQLTGDRAWIEGRFVPTRTRGLEDNVTSDATFTARQKSRIVD